MDKLPLFQKGYVGGIKFAGDHRNFPRFLFYSIVLLVCLCFLIMVMRLFQLTIVKGNYYRELSEQNRVREIIIEPKRGKIVDRKGFVIAENTLTDINNIKPDLSRLTSSRIYNNPEAVAHLIGYRQIADQNDLNNDSCLNKLIPGDKVGKKGIEKLFDCQLRGRPGKKLIEVDARGKYLRTLSIIPPVDGQTIQLSVDLELQQKTYELIKNKKAAIVGIKPQTGEVVLFVSSPSFNPQDFENNNSEKITKYLTDKEKPLFNRITEATYPPGSLFKLVVATAALEEKGIDEKTLVEDTGTLTAGPLKFGNWYFLQYGKTDGMVDIVKAIQRSNDIFFYKAGESVGPDKIKTWAERLGYGKSTELGLGETEGLIPSSFWKQETLHDRWYLGDTYNFSIGQGWTLVTPIQTAMVTSIFANSGQLCQPEFLKNFNPNCRKISISNKTVDLIRQGMKAACSTGGTGWPLFNFKIATESANKNASSSAGIEIQTACKTGTAESLSKETNPHAWFTVFAPYEKPEIVLSILIEEGGQGSDIGGPIAKEILKNYFERIQ